MELALSISVPELPAALEGLDDLDDLVLNEMYLAMLRSVDTVEQAVVQRTPVASGATRQGWGTSVQRGVAAVKGKVSNPVDHAYYAEKGRGPGKQPPIDVILHWVRRTQGMSEQDARSVAYLIARAIGRRGTEGAHMAEKGLAATKPLILADFNAIPERVVAKAGI